LAPGGFGWGRLWSWFGVDFGLLGEEEDLAAVGAVGEVGEGGRPLVGGEGVRREGVELVGIEVMIEALAGLGVLGHLAASLLLSVLENG